LQQLNAKETEIKSKIMIRKKIKRRMKRLSGL